ncbi:YpbB family protein [Thermaerobacillus caldiproteolyticus]|uniref:helix-turn-helix domain-containing protein n=1 Tax=Thermaerobacillus caldiproteolyticus TaxID=247480 RepID=UPI0018F2741E|nr:helix-turn-helix domain-containing protein [Anoxybacillus caldiproteolyticus]
MKSDYGSFLLLFCLQRLNGERSLSALYHLFSGKKSSQTLQDSKWFRLERFFGVWKELELHEIEAVVRKFVEKQWVVPTAERSYLLTRNGKDQLEQWLQQSFFPIHLNGWKYHSSEMLFWYRLSLLVQTLSNVIHRRTFEPIHRHEETFVWIKRYLFAQKRSTRELAGSLYEDIRTLLASISEEEATVFTLRLTSFERIGWTNEQLAVFLKKDPIYIRFMFQHVLHYIMEKVETDKLSFPTLYELLCDISPSIPLTLSAQKTYEWLRKGKTIDEIARLRRLKRSTIEDHIVEIAANIDEFSIEPFVNQKRASQIMEAVQRLQTRKLRQIREAVGENIHYFEIRLVLAKIGDVYEP